MIFAPIFPIDTKSQELVDFCVHFISVAGFVEVYEMKLEELQRPTIAYEATEQLYVGLFGRRRYSDREVFYNVLSRYRAG
jgi:hypothetical protein